MTEPQAIVNEEEVEIRELTAEEIELIGGGMMGSHKSTLRLSQ